MREALTLGNSSLENQVNFLEVKIIKTTTSGRKMCERLKGKVNRNSKMLKIADNMQRKMT
jgi:hypothetical protein